MLPWLLFPTLPGLKYIAPDVEKKAEWHVVHVSCRDEDIFSIKDYLVVQLNDGKLEFPEFSRLPAHFFECKCLILFCIQYLGRSFHILGGGLTLDTEAAQFAAS